jgi:hypothetical protein
MSASDPAARPAGIEFYGGYQVYSETGVDLTLLRENLKRSPETRFAQDAGFLELVKALQESGPIGRAKRSRVADTFAPTALLDHLARARVEYVLIGGLAMRVQGSAYVTEDLDVCYERSDQNLEALVAALGPLQPRLRGIPDSPFRFDAPTLRAGLNFALMTSLGDVDLFGEVAGVGPYADALARSNPIFMFGLTVRVLSVDALIASKTAVGRNHDRLHLLELEELKKLRDAQP